jgi:pimeloyl-ACP methyl ester carboxylesterase
MSQPQLPQLEGVDHHFLELPGLRMHVAEAGSGIPVLLLHGFPQHWWEWRKVIPALAEQFRVICPDLRGAGWTAAPRRGYTRDRLLADVVALRPVACPAILTDGYQADCYKLHLSCILASIP